MTGSGDAWRRGESRRRAVHADQAALLAIVLRRGVCDATGEPLDARNAVAMTVTVAPGVSRLAVVTRAHWEGGTGALSSADPAADKDVLDGRRLFGDGPPPGERHARGGDYARRRRRRFPCHLPAGPGGGCARGPAGAACGG
jgi:hypothetical protein